MTSPALPPCSRENGLLAAELKRAADRGFVSPLDVHETDDGTLYVTARLKLSGADVWYLVTRRRRDTPQPFRDLTRLSRYLRRLAPKVDFILHRGSSLPFLADSGPSDR